MPGSWCCERIEVVFHDLSSLRQLLIFVLDGVSSWDKPWHGVLVSWIGRSKNSSLLLQLAPETMNGSHLPCSFWKQATSSGHSTAWERTLDTTLGQGVQPFQSFIGCRQDHTTIIIELCRAFGGCVGYCPSPTTNHILHFPGAPRLFLFFTSSRYLP